MISSATLYYPILYSVKSRYILLPLAIVCLLVLSYASLRYLMLNQAPTISPHFMLPLAHLYSITKFLLTDSLSYLHTYLHTGAICRVAYATKTN